tara:strand:+ start:47 stop:370 length:324 start_codon:yes stop_codon:yes gene_type:complete
MTIKCKWRENKQVLINPDGQVYPCCFLSNIDYFVKETNNNEKGYHYPMGPQTVVMTEYNKHKFKLNVKNNKMEDILKNDWWKFLENSWNDSDKVDRRCVRYCSIKDA